jgi:hypothetical protein
MSHREREKGTTKLCSTIEYTKKKREVDSVFGNALLYHIHDGGSGTPVHWATTGHWAISSHWSTTGLLGWAITNHLAITGHWAMTGLPSDAWCRAIQQVVPAPPHQRRRFSFFAVVARRVDALSNFCFYLSSLFFSSFYFFPEAFQVFTFVNVDSSTR